MGKEYLVLANTTTLNYNFKEGIIQSKHILFQSLDSKCRMESQSEKDRMDLKEIS